MLSEHERRSLDLIEQTLTADDPELARRLGSRHGRPFPTWLLTGLAVLVMVGVGLALIILGGDLRQQWLSAPGALLAATAPLLACMTADGQHRWRGHHWTS